MEKAYNEYFNSQYITGENIIATNKLEGKYLSLNDDNIRLSESNSHIQNDLSVQNQLSALTLSLNNKIFLSENNSYIKSPLTIGDNTTANSNAIVELSSNNKGLLLPILTITNRDNLSNVEGLIVYNSDNSDIEYNDGSIWRGLKPFTPQFVKFLDIDNATAGGYGYANAQSLQDGWSSGQTALLRRNYTTLNDYIVSNQAAGDNLHYVRYTTGTLDKGVYKIYFRLGKDNTSPLIQIKENNNNVVLLNNYDLHHPAGNGDDNAMTFEVELYVENNVSQALQFEIDVVGNSNTSFTAGYLLILQGGYLVRVN